MKEGSDGEARPKKTNPSSLPHTWPNRATVTIPVRAGRTSRAADVEDGDEARHALASESSQGARVTGSERNLARATCAGVGSLVVARRQAGR